MNNHFQQLIDQLKERFRILLGICLGIFLFVLFFEPFSIYLLDINNRLVFLVGLTVIFFLLMVVVYVVLPHIFKKSRASIQEMLLSSYVKGFILVVINSIALTFYLRYVGLVEMSFLTIFKILVISMVPPIVVGLQDTINKLKQHDAELIIAREKDRHLLEKHKEDVLARTITLYSEGGKETTSLRVADLVYVMSADNYVEIVYKNGEDFEKKLIRNTLKNIQQLLDSYSNFVRCHRTCIVNIHYIDQLKKSHNNYWLSMKSIDKKIPVSRQYLLKIKEVV